MNLVPREYFVLNPDTHLAYSNIPLPIGEGQTISQPYIVAMMISALDLKPTDSVLDIGTGSGYQAAVLSKLTNSVISVERIKSLCNSASKRLEFRGYSKVKVRMAKLQLGWPYDGPYDAIIVAAGSPRLPPELIDQLIVGGRLVIPVGSKEMQELVRVQKFVDGFSVQTLGPCKFVPLLGMGAWPE